MVNEALTSRVVAKFRRVLLRPFQRLDRTLPRGLLDAARQFALFYAAYYLYSLVRGGSGANEHLALANGRDVIALEKSLGLWIEGHVQAFAVDHRWLVDFANFMYVNSHFTITVLFLFWLYLLHNANFYFVRNLMMVAMVLALVGYGLYPTMPPRFVPGLGIQDTIATVGGIQRDETAVKALINPYAAIPSMHCCFSLVVAVTCFRLVKWRWLARAWLLYPALVTFVVMATGNHYWFDAVLGWAVAGLSFAAAQAMASWRKDVWAFRPSREEATI